MATWRVGIPTHTGRTEPKHHQHATCGHCAPPPAHPLSRLPTKTLCGGLPPLFPTSGAGQATGLRPVLGDTTGAPCLRYEVPLVTLNAADFTDLAEHHGLVLP